MSLPKSRSSTVMWSIWVIASIFYAYQYILRVMPNIMMDDIMQQFHVGAAAFGQFSGVYYIGYALIHLPIGIMLDRFGPRKVMSGCILLTIAGMTPLLFTTQWIYPVIGRVLIGVGSSAAILGVFKVIRMAFEEKSFSRMLSFSVMIGLIGAIYGGGPISYMRDTLGYVAVVQIFSFLGLLLAGLTYWIVPEMEGTSEGPVLSNIKALVKNKRVIFSCIFAGLMVGPLEGFADVWGTAFLKQVCGLDGMIAASLPTMIFVGMCFGAPVLSLIAEKVGSHLLALVGAGVVMSIAFFAMLSSPMLPNILSLVFLLVGVCCGYQILAVYKVSTYVNEQSVGLATAMANMIIMIFGYAFHSTIGLIVHSLGGPTVSKALIYGISVIPISLCLGTLGYFALFMQEKALARKSA